jgi:hypothetical protein
MIRAMPSVAAPAATREHHHMIIMRIFMRHSWKKLFDPIFICIYLLEIEYRSISKRRYPCYAIGSNIRCY